MRVAYFTGTYPRATDTFIQREVISLRNRGMFVQTFSVRRPGDNHIVGPEQEKERSQTDYLLPPNFLYLLWSHSLLFSASPARYLKSIILAFQTSQPGLRGLIYQAIYFLEAGILAFKIRKSKITHLHNHIADSSCTVAMLASALGDFSFSFTLHGPYIFYEPYRWALKTKICQAKFVSCISYFCRSQAMYLSSVDEWHKLVVVHCGVDPDMYPTVVHRDKSSNILCVGRLSAAKGFPILLESIAMVKKDLPSVHLTIVGDGEDRQVLEELAKRLKVDQHVSFVGYKSQGEVRDYLYRSDVFVLPSFAEGVPVSLMEAMASGVPVVSTRIAGISELVEDGISGYLVPPGDPKTLAEKVGSLLESAELRQAFGIAGRQKVEEEFNLSKETDWLHKVITSCLMDVPVETRPTWSSCKNEEHETGTIQVV